MGEKEHFRDGSQSGITSTLEQQDAVEMEFIELHDVPVKKVWSIPEGNEGLRVEPLTPQSELR